MSNSRVLPPLSVRKSFEEILMGRSCASTLPITDVLPESRPRRRLRHDIRHRQAASPNAKVEMLSSFPYPLVPLRPAAIPSFVFVEGDQSLSEPASAKPRPISFGILQNSCY